MFSNPSFRISTVLLFTTVSLYAPCFQINKLLNRSEAEYSVPEPKREAYPRNRSCISKDQFEAVTLVEVLLVSSLRKL